MAETDGLQPQWEWQRVYSKSTATDIDREPGCAGSIQGQLLRHSDRREVAIFLRDGALWVADFIDGEGELIDATTWFRFHCAAPSSPHGRRRMVLESAVPLSPDLVARIRHLYASAPTRKRGGISRLLNGFTESRAFRRLGATINRFPWRRRTP